MMHDAMRIAERLAAAEKRRAIRRLAAMIQTRFAPAQVQASGQGVEICGRILNRRWVSDPALRFMGIGK